MTRVQPSLVALLLGVTFVLAASASAQTVLGAAAAPPARPALTLAQALDAAVERDADIITARSALRAAQRTLERTQADPLALRVDTLAAEDALAGAEETLASRAAAVRRLAAADYAGLLQAIASQGEAERARAIAGARLEATRAKRDAGAATDLDLADAEDALASAERDAREAVTATDLARSTLQTATGLDASTVAAIGAADLPSLPALDAALAQARSASATLSAGRRQLVLSEAKLAGVDNAFSARADVQAAQDDVDAARTTLDAAGSTVELTLRQAYADMTAAEHRYHSAQEALATASDDLAAQAARFRAGSLAPLAWQEAQLTFARTSAALELSLHQRLLSALDLQRAILE